MTDGEFVALWLGAGMVGFSLARSAWGLTFGCQPIKVSTVLMFIAVVWFPPLTFLAAVVFTGCWLVDGDVNSTGGPLKGVLDKEIGNPCRWYAALRQRIGR